jgi:hypothetical protein
MMLAAQHWHHFRLLTAMDQQSGSTADDLLDHLSSQVPRSEEEDNTLGDADLSRWDYLTRTYDHAHLFSDDLTPNNQEWQSNHLNHAGMHYLFGIAESDTAAQFSSPTVQSALHSSAGTIETAAALPSQTTNYGLPGTNHAMYPASGLHSLRLSPSSQVYDTGNSLNVGWPHQSGGNEQHHRDELGNSKLQVDDAFSLEPIPLDERGMAARGPNGVHTMRHLSSTLGEALHTFRSFSSASHGPSILPSEPNLETTMAPVFSGIGVGDRKANSPSNMPSRLNLEHMSKPLSSYNYFYRVERDNIVLGMKNQGDPLPPTVLDFSQSKMEMLLHHHWYVPIGALLMFSLRFLTRSFSTPGLWILREENGSIERYTVKSSSPSKCACTKQYRLVSAPLLPFSSRSQKRSYPQTGQGDCPSLEKATRVGSRLLPPSGQGRFGPV